MGDEYRYHVYMMQSASRRALYIGMTSNLRNRVFQHKTQEFRRLPTVTTPSVWFFGSVSTTYTKPSSEKSS
jgi:predicted GIY-YIG superfamily endonuclease